MLESYKGTLRASYEFRGSKEQVTQSFETEGTSRLQVWPGIAGVSIR